MRFEVVTAFIVGILLPVLETVRRGVGHWSVDFTTMFEDHVAGALLLIAGAVSLQGKRYASLWLLLAWGYVTGMMGSSFWWQLESTFRGVETEPDHGLVLLFKFLLWATCLSSLVSSFRRARANSGT